MATFVTGPSIFLAMILVSAAEFGGGRYFYLAAGVFLVVYLLCVIADVRWSRRAFVLTGILLVIIAFATREDWLSLSEAALKSASFIGAFFVALAWLREAAGSSPAMQRCGRYLASQPPGRRYAALTLGGHLFALVLNYGSITLLGTMVENSIKDEPNEEIRQARLKRMLVAVQRGFISTLCWSPLTFSLVLSTTLTPGATWFGALGYGIVNMLLTMGIGWGLDSIFKPKLSVPLPGRKPVIGTIQAVYPLIGILALLFLLIGIGYLLTGIRVVAIVMIIVPCLSLGWIALQNFQHTANPILETAVRGKRYVLDELPAFRSELVLLVMAGFIGTMGAKLALPYVDGGMTALAELPAWVILVAIVWLIPVTGQLGMNPILSVAVIAPLLPHAETLGTSPNVIVAALTAGWTLGGASSPFTATTMLIGKLGGVSAHRVGLVWNGQYTIVLGLAFSAWVTFLSVN